MTHALKCSPNTQTSDVTLNGGHMFCGSTSSEIGYLSGVTSKTNIYTNSMWQYNFNL